jgi:hypothetical protein
LSSESRETTEADRYCESAPQTSEDTHHSLLPIMCPIRLWISGRRETSNTDGGNGYNIPST